MAAERAGVRGATVNEMARKTVRTSVREGYDRWATTYDTTPNPVVAMDARHTLRLLNPQPGERILDAGCGTGRHLGPLLRAGARPVGLGFSGGMLRVARQRVPESELVQGDLQGQFPFRGGRFTAVLCALITEHLTELPRTLREFRRALRPGGRLILSIFHPDLAQVGKEANFTEGDTEYRLGAIRWTVADYLEQVSEAGFPVVEHREWSGDEQLRSAVSSAPWVVGSKVLLTIEARVPH